LFSKNLGAQCCKNEIVVIFKLGMENLSQKAMNGQAYFSTRLKVCLNMYLLTQINLNIDWFSGELLSYLQGRYNDQVLLLVLQRKPASQLIVYLKSIFVVLIAASNP
jgi:hypothetical protein